MEGIGYYDLFSSSLVLQAIIDQLNLIKQMFSHHRWIGEAGQLFQ